MFANSTLVGLALEARTRESQPGILLTLRFPKTAILYQNQRKGLRAKGVKDTFVKKRKTFGCLAASCALVGGLLFYLYLTRSERSLDARIEDMHVLTSMCLDATNTISSTEELLTATRGKGITLRSPIPRDPSQPCYRLVNPYVVGANFVAPNDILIEEINITDNQVLVSTMDGSVFLRVVK